MAGRRWWPTLIWKAPTARFIRNITQDEAGLKKLFKQFSFPGGIPSHVAPETPGSIHEGGELGYSLSHAFGAVFDNPDLIVACVVGDGEAETGPLATAWHSNKFLDPAHRRRGAADSASQWLQDRQSDGAGAHSATKNWSSCCAATAGRRICRRRTSRRRCIRRWRRRWMQSIERDPADSERCARRTESPRGRAGR